MGQFRTLTTPLGQLRYWEQEPRVSQGDAAGPNSRPDLGQGLGQNLGQDFGVNSGPDRRGDPGHHSSDHPSNPPGNQPSDDPIANPANLPSSTSPDRLPPLVFCHGLGLGSSAFEWSKVYPSLGDRHRIIVPEFLGWGRSDKPQGAYTLQNYLTQLTLILTQVARSPAWVIAASLTGGLALRLASEQPHLFHGLALVSPSGYGDFGQTYRNPVLPWLAPWGGDQALYALLTQPWAIAAAIDRFLLSPTSVLSPSDRHPIYHAYTTAAQQPHAHRAALATLRGDLCFDLARFVPHLQVPCHLLWGAQAQASPLATGQRLQQLNPRWIQSLQPLPHAGMLPHLEQPDFVQRWLRSLLSPVGGCCSITPCAT